MHVDMRDVVGSGSALLIYDRYVRILQLHDPS
jgi:hypothetical protein